MCVDLRAYPQYGHYVPLRFLSKDLLRSVALRNTESASYYLVDAITHGDRSGIEILCNLSEEASAGSYWRTLELAKGTLENLLINEDHETLKLLIKCRYVLPYPKYPELVSCGANRFNYAECNPILRTGLDIAMHNTSIKHVKTVLSLANNVTIKNIEVNFQRVQKLESIDQTAMKKAVRLIYIAKAKNGTLTLNDVSELSKVLDEPELDKLVSKGTSNFTAVEYLQAKQQENLGKPLYGSVSPMQNIQDVLMRATYSIGVDGAKIYQWYTSLLGINNLHVLEMVYFVAASILTGSTVKIIFANHTNTKFSKSEFNPLSNTVVVNIKQVRLIFSAFADRAIVSTLGHELTHYAHAEVARSYQQQTKNKGSKDVFSFEKWFEENFERLQAEANGNIITLEQIKDLFSQFLGITDETLRLSQLYNAAARDVLQCAARLTGADEIPDYYFRLKHYAAEAHRRMFALTLFLVDQFASDSDEYVGLALARAANIAHAQGVCRQNCTAFYDKSVLNSYQTLSSKELTKDLQCIIDTNKLSTSEIIFLQRVADYVAHVPNQFAAKQYSSSSYGESYPSFSTEELHLNAELPAYFMELTTLYQLSELDPSVLECFTRTGIFWDSFASATIRKVISNATSKFAGNMGSNVFAIPAPTQALLLVGPKETHADYTKSEVTTSTDSELPGEVYPIQD